MQIVKTGSEKTTPTFVEKLDSLNLAEQLKLERAPVMIYGDDVTHIVTEGIAGGEGTGLEFGGRSASALAIYARLSL